MGKGRIVRIYSNKSRTVFVASGDTCPRINMGKEQGVNISDDYSKGLKLSKSIVKRIFS